MGLVLGWVTTYEYPCCNKLFFFSFFSHPFSRQACRTPALCNVVSSTCIYHQFVSQFALSVFTHIYLQYHWRNVDFEYSSRDHLGTLGFVASPRQYSNKSESSKYTANGDLAIKSGFVNVVSSAILNSQAGYRCTLVTRLPFPVSHSPFPVTSFSNIPLSEIVSLVVHFGASYFRVLEFYGIRSP